MCPPREMNLSGEAVLNAMRYFNISLENVIVLYDDVSFDVGQMRIRKNGSSGGHNGIKSIEQHVGSSDFLRVKIGVGKKPEGWELANWVLSHYASEEDRKVQFDAFMLAADTVIDWIKNDWNSAMRTANAPKK